MSTIHTPEYQQVINRLIKARKEAKLTQKEVAKMINKPQSFISKIETCQRRIDILELKEFTEIYKVEIDKLVE